MGSEVGTHKIRLPLRSDDPLPVDDELHRSLTDTGVRDWRDDYWVLVRMKSKILPFRHIVNKRLLNGKFRVCLRNEHYTIRSRRSATLPNHS